MKYKTIRKLLVAVGITVALTIPTAAMAAEDTENTIEDSETPGINDSGNAAESGSESDTNTDQSDQNGESGNVDSGSGSGNVDENTGNGETVEDNGQTQLPAAEEAIQVKPDSSANSGGSSQSGTGQSGITENTWQNSTSDEETSGQETAYESIKVNYASLGFSYNKILRDGFEVIQKWYAYADIPEGELLMVRESPFEDGREIGSLSSKAICYILADSDQDWVYIESGDVRGFVQREFLEMSEEAQIYIEEVCEFNMEVAEKILDPEENTAFAYVPYTVYNLVDGVQGEQIVELARQYVGNPYVWGGNSLTEGIDCSHFVWNILTMAGAYSGEYYTSYGWRTLGEEVESLEQAQAGDIVCYDGHVAIYDGNGKIVEARGRAYGITEDRDVDCHEILAIRRFAKTTLDIGDYETELLGNFRLTAYCNCEICCGKWANGYTASGSIPKAGRTVAIAASTMERLGLHFGDQIYLRGNVYTIEDHGGSEMAISNGGLCVDIYCDTHEECFDSAYAGFDDVYLITGVKDEAAQ